MINVFLKLEKNIPYLLDSQLKKDEGEFQIDYLPQIFGILNYGGKAMKNLDAQYQIMAEEMWLKYYNRVLFEKKLISEEQRNKMILAIESRCDRKRKQIKAV